MKLCNVGPLVLEIVSKESTLGSCPGSPPRHPHCPPWWRSFHFPSAHRRRHKRCTWTTKMRLPSYSKVRMTSYPSRALWTNCESSSNTSAWPVCGPNTRSNSKSYLRRRDNLFQWDNFGFLIIPSSWTCSSIHLRSLLAPPAPDCWLLNSSKFFSSFGWCQHQKRDDNCYKPTTFSSQCPK